MFDGMSRAIVVVPQEKMIVYPDHDESILEKNISRFPVLNQVLFANQFLFTLVSVIKSSSMFDGMSRAIVVVPQEKMIVYPDHDESILEKNFSRFPP